VHVVMFADQHLESSGGAQVSMRLQRRYLERAGHRVSVVAPRLLARRVDDPAYIDLPALPVTLDREYSLAVPGRRSDRFVDAALRDRPPVDVVHVQADFWGAVIGHRFAARHALPVVHTMHNRVDVGIEATLPFPRLALRGLNAWARHALAPADRGVPGGAGSADGWAFLRRYGMLSHAVTAPSAHFAARLERHGVVPARFGADAVVDVVWNGIDDDVLDAALAAGGSPRRAGVARFVWVGRMSPEKRLVPFLDAVTASDVDAEIEVIGGGGQRAAAERLVRRRAPRARVRFAGRLPYPQTLRRIAEADAVVQTSVGFETQGMTVFEAASLGTPSVVSDPDIASELGEGRWDVADASVGALAEALRRAAADIVAGTAPVADARVGEQFRQSSRTRAMIAVYERAIEAAR
jgi:1,2-diacylglycerol 3-alpha-glucosyltransferase